MQIRRWLVGGLAGVLGVFGVDAGPQAAGPATEMGPRLHKRAVAVDGETAALGRVIVKYRAGSGLMKALSVPASASVAGAAAPEAGQAPLHAATLSRRLGLPLRDGRVLGARTQALRGQGVSSSVLAARLAAEPDVEWAVVDGRRTVKAVIPNDPYFAGGQTAVTPAAGQWYLRAPDATVRSSINAVGAWALTLGSPAITVAVLDTGVRFDHPDLAGKLHPGYDFVSDDDVDATEGRDADASDPGDWTTAGQCGSGEPATDSSWHGTQVAGLVGAATDNAVGIAGSGRNVMVLPVRVLGQCGGFDSDIIAAMRWAGGLSSLPVANPHPARVLNMSLGGTGSCNRAYQDVVDALAAARVTVVAAAGNDAGLVVSTPANCTGAVAVAGVRHIGTKVGYSNVGPQVAIAAPAGNCVNTSGSCVYPLLTTVNAGRTTPSSNGYSDGVNYSVGTSFSAPLVAGTVGLMLSADPTLTPARIRSALAATARPFPATGSGPEVTACVAPSAVEQIECYCTTATCGAGMLDAAAAVAAVTPAAVAPPAAVIDVPTTSPMAGFGVPLSSTGSSANGGRSIAAYSWQITQGASLAVLTGAVNGPTATLLTQLAGSVTVRLTVTDSGGAASSADVVLQVQPAPVVVTPSGGGGTPAAGNGGGGGAVSLGWAAALLGAVAALRRRRSSPAETAGTRTEG